MQNRTELGMNRTGMQMSPVGQARMREVTDMTTPSSEGDESALAEIRAPYIAESDGLGSVPPPGSVKGMVKTTAKVLGGQRPQAFIDKLGERLAFERTGTRLYEAFLGKCEAQPDTGAVDLEQLRHFCREEAEHFALVKECIETLGGDPTAQTPCADVAGVEGMGLMQVITAPNTTVTQSLHAILVAELTDNAAWEELVMLAREMGQEDMARRFEECTRHEAEHLETVKRWHLEATLQEAKVTAH